MFLFCQILQSPSLLSFNTCIMSDLNNTLVHWTPVPLRSTVSMDSIVMSGASMNIIHVLSTVWSLITIWRLLVCLLIIGNLKNIPFLWHVSSPSCSSNFKYLTMIQMRIVNAFRFTLKTQRPKVDAGPEQLFQTLITSSQASIMELDFNLHSK
jgi:hypothetical protein